MSPDLSSNTAQRYAALDLGSNTVRLLVAEPKREGFTVLHSSQVITRLGERMHETGTLRESAMDRTLSGVESLIEGAAALRPFKIAVTATHALRAAKNGGLFKEKFREKMKFDLMAIEQDREASLTMKGAAMVVKPETVVVLFDVGGGSTEFIYRNGDMNAKLLGTDLGVVRLSETFIKHAPLKREEFDCMAVYINKEIAAVAGQLAIEQPFTLVGTAGTITSLAAVHYDVNPYDPERINNRVLSAGDIKALLKKIGGQTIKERSRIPAISNGREDLVIPGIGIVLAVMEGFKVDTLTVCDAGLREGVMLSLIDGGIKGTQL